MPGLPAPIASQRLVARLLDDPEAITIVQSLDGHALRALVERVGLEDSSEIVSLATAAQLERVFDEDLWKSNRPGKDETFDAARFALWLEVLLLAGEEVAIEKIAALDEDLVTLGITRQVLVVDIDALAVEMAEDLSDDAKQMEKALEGALYQEIDEFRLIAKNPDTFDAVVALVVALDKDHHDFVRRLLERCCAISTEYIEDNGGLYDVLTSDASLESDVAGEREDRREREGYVAPSAALSFLKLARATSLDEIVAARAHDPVTRAHFRAAPAPVASKEVSPKVAALLRELRPVEAPRRAKRIGAGARPFERAMAELRERDATTFARRVDELAYLVNVLVAGCAYEGRAFRPIEAAEAVSAVCAVGLARMRRARDEITDVVAREDLVKAFRVGWHVVGADEWSAKKQRTAEGTK